MYTIHSKSAHMLTGFHLFFIGLFFFVGCSQQAPSKPPETTTGPRTTETTRKLATSAPSKAPQDSSLEALQKGTLGNSAKDGPLRDVIFDFDRYDVRTDMRDILKGHAVWLKANPQVRVEIEGHCDERGTNEYNLALGAKRADSVKRYLIDLGISPDRLSTISYGEELPTCKEQNEACWAKTRRAHFVVRAGLAT